MTSDPERSGAADDAHAGPEDPEVGGSADDLVDDDLGPLERPLPTRERRKILPRTTRASILWIVAGFLIGVLVPSFALASGTSAASSTVRDAVDGAAPLTSSQVDLEGENTYLIVGEPGVSGQCVVTGPDGSSLDIELEAAHQAGQGTYEVSLGSFAAGSGGRYSVECDAGGADLGLTRSPPLGGWSILGGPMLVGGIGLVVGFAIGVVGLFSWIGARRNRWKRA